MDKHVAIMAEERGFESAPVAPQLFGNAGREHMEKYGTGSNDPNAVMTLTPC